MSSLVKRPLKFPLLDDIQALSHKSQILELKETILEDLGPAMELYLRDKAALIARLSRSPVTATERAIIDIPLNRLPSVTSNYRPCEIVGVPPKEEDFGSTSWTSFLLRAQRAAEASGVNRSLAQALTGTMEEMAENVFWHSEATDTGVAGYRWAKCLFEYFVGDSGIGVLESLRRIDRYSELTDSVDALSMAVKNGVSRFPPEESRGTGFNSLLRNIAKNCCDLRLHSGDGVLSYEGIKSFYIQEPIKVKDFSASHLGGFAISLTCKS